MSKNDFNTNTMLVDGKPIKKVTEKFYTIDEFGKTNIPDDLCRSGSHNFVATTVSLDETGRFCTSLSENHYSGKLIGKSVLNWYDILPNNVRKAIDVLEQKNDEKSAIAFLLAMQKAYSNKNNTMPYCLYPRLYIYGHERCWGTDSAYGFISLTRDGNFQAYGQEGPAASPCNYGGNGIGSAESRIDLINRSAVHNIYGYKAVFNHDMEIFAAGYNNEYIPNTKVLKSFCKDYKSKNEIKPLNEYLFYAKQTQRGEDSTTVKKVNYTIFAKSKKEAYAKFLEKVDKHNNEVRHQWYPGWEGRPYQDARPISEGRLVAKAVKNSI